MSDLIVAGYVERLAFAEQLAAQSSDQQLFALVELWTSYWRDVMLVQAGCPDACSNIDMLADVAQHAQETADTAVRHFLHTLRRVNGYLQRTVNTRLALDVLLMDLPRPA
jgi:DNA polymerase-3 subunit delta'